LAAQDSVEASLKFMPEGTDKAQAEAELLVKQEHAAKATEKAEMLYSAVESRAHWLSAMQAVRAAEADDAVNSEEIEGLNAAVDDAEVKMILFTDVVAVGSIAAAAEDALASSTLPQTAQELPERTAFKVAAAEAHVSRTNLRHAQLRDTVQALVAQQRKESLVQEVKAADEAEASYAALAEHEEELMHLSREALALQRASVAEKAAEGELCGARGLWGRILGLGNQHVWQEGRRMLCTQCMAHCTPATRCPYLLATPASMLESPAKEVCIYHALESESLALMHRERADKLRRLAALSVQVSFNADSRHFKADSRHFNADSRHFNANSRHFDADSRHFNADSRHFNADSRRFNANSRYFHPPGTLSESETQSRSTTTLGAGRGCGDWFVSSRFSPCYAGRRLPVRRRVPSAAFPCRHDCRMEDVVP